MLRQMRHIIILLVALTFSVSSVGWSVASVVSGGMPGKGHHSAIGVPPAGQVDLHGDTGHEHSSSASHATCDETSGVECRSDPQESGEASSCCAAACHTAMLTGHDVQAVHMLSHVADHAPLIVGMNGAAGVRFERPPRSADI